MKSVVVSLLTCALVFPVGVLAQEGADLNTISSVQVQGGTVRIIGTKKPNFTTFTMTDPPRLVIDISEAVFSGVKDEIPVGNDTITGIRTASYGSEQSAIARVLIGYARDVETDIQASDNALVVSVVGGGAPVVAQAEREEAPGTNAAEAAAAAAAERERQEREAAEAAAAAAAERERQEREATEAATAAAAERERQEREAAAAAKAEAQARREAEARAEAERKSQEEAARVAAAQASERERREAEARAATEAKARREEAARAAAEAKRQARDEAQARAAEEKARRAEEARAAAEAKRQAREEARQARMAARERPSPQRESLSVSSQRKTMTLVGFHQEPGASRVFVRTNEPVSYSVSEEGNRVVVLVLENTRIESSNNTLPLNTSYFDTPVASVDPSVGPSRSVRVVIRLKEQVPFQAHQEGNEIFIEFPRR